MKAGFVTTIRFNPRVVLACINAAEQSGVYLPPGTSLSVVISQGIRVIVETLIDMKMLPDDDGFEYSKRVEKYAVSNRRAKTLAGMRVEQLANAARMQDGTDVPIIDTNTIVSEGNSNLGIRYQKLREELLWDFKNDPVNFLPAQEAKLLALNEVFMGEARVEDLPFTPSGGPKNAILTDREREHFAMMKEVLDGKRTLDSLPFTFDGEDKMISPKPANDPAE